jgi:hypothetical protein
MTLRTISSPPVAKIRSFLAGKILDANQIVPETQRHSKYSRHHPFRHIPPLQTRVIYQ